MSHPTLPSPSHKCNAQKRQKSVKRPRHKTKHQLSRDDKSRSQMQEQHPRPLAAFTSKHRRNGGRPCFTPDSQLSRKIGVVGLANVGFGGNRHARCLNGHEETDTARWTRQLTTQPLLCSQHNPTNVMRCKCSQQLRSTMQAKEICIVRKKTLSFPRANR